MKDPITTPGKTYAVTSPNGCTVTTEDGLTLAEVEAGKQGYFVAVSGKVQLSDDSAILTQLFKLAPQQRLALLGVLGGGNPAWKLKYAACVDAKAVYEADPEVNQWTGTSQEGGRGYQFFDVRSDGSIPFSFDSLKSIAPLSGGYAHNMFDYLCMKRGVKKLHLKLPIVTEWVGINGLEEINLDAPNLIRFYENYSNSLKKLKVNSLKIINLNYAASNSPIEIIEGEFPVLKSGKISENNGILDKASVLRICNTVPTWTTGTHELWLGIHLDHQYDPDVNLALKRVDINYEPTVELPEEVTEGKGWTLKVQWNGTPTTQTAGTFAMGSLIYAKVSELENGERYLDWGHYVTNWEERGYEMFRSVEAAREYYGLPAEDLTNN